jgi:hypothetical protein
MSSNKRWTLEKREQELRRALLSHASQEAITRAAEHVREAQLAILKKAKSEAAPAETRPTIRTKAPSTIQRERKKWLDATVAGIISQVQRGKA